MELNIRDGTGLKDCEDIVRSAQDREQWRNMTANLPEESGTL